MSDLPEIPPYDPNKPIDPLGLFESPENAQLHLDWEERRADEFICENPQIAERYCYYDSETHTFKGKKVKPKGKRVHFAICRDRRDPSYGIIITSDKANFGLCGMGCLTSY
jgi:hypothetical protein